MTTAKKRSNGEGNIRKRKDGRWEGRYTAGHDPETGKAIYKNVLAKTQKECKEKLAAALEQAGNGQVILFVHILQDIFLVQKFPLPPLYQHTDNATARMPFR